MEAKKKNVSIGSLPKEPARIAINHSPDEKMNVDMNMHLVVRQPVPVCVRLCEPICAKSDYKISINFLNKPIGSISIKGMTKLFTCSDNQEQKICVKFSDLKEGMVFETGIKHEGLTITPVGNQIVVITNYDPEGINKLKFPPTGIKIDFPYPVDKVSMRVFSHTEQVFRISAYVGSLSYKTEDESVHVGLNTIEIAQDDMTSVILSGGKFAEALIEVCYFCN